MTAEIMIVEDEFIIQTEMKIRLERLGYHVAAVSGSGEEAVALAGKVKPQLILMDIQLEGAMDGIEAAGRIKEFLKVPIIFTTAYTDEKKVERAKFSIPHGYLIKPVQEQELKIAITMALYAAEMDAARKKAEEQLQDTVHQLQEALDKVKLLSGLLPICSRCKKIRDDQGYWNQLESYIEKHSDAQFSHGICSDCAEELYGKESWYKKMKKDKS